MNFCFSEYEYPSQRTVVFGRKGMVATTQPLASQAGLEILKNGGNAIDAAIATAACLTVVEPTSNGIGGDAFAIVWTKGNIYGLNSSGPSPKAINIDSVIEKGYKKIPQHGFIPVTIPGQPYGWKELSRRFGKLPLKKVLEPAIDYGRNGFPVSPVVSYNWQRAANNYKNKLKGEEFKHWFDTFTIDGKAPKAGQMWRNRDIANTLEELGKTNCMSFYEGDIAEKIHKFSKEYGGYIRKNDLIEYKSEWVKPLSVNYRGYDIWELPPNTHGIVVLMALNILKNFDLKKDDSKTYHRMIEALKLAYADGLYYITDLNKMGINIDELISKDYGIERAKLIKDKAIMPQFGTLNSGGTVYFATADSEGNMVSYIQSNFTGFGSGLVVPETGISLHNRGYTFSLDPNAYNKLESQKKTYHTIIPGFVTRNNQPIGPFGVMGAYMQPQGHLQVINNMLDHYLNPQEALDKPRWKWINDKTVFVEKDFSKDIVEELKKMGHEIKYSDDVGSFGRGQIILKNKDVLIGGTEKRADGYIGVW